MGTGNAVRVFETEEFERFDEEGEDDGAHEERTGATEEACHRHHLHWGLGVEVRCACIGVGNTVTVTTYTSYYNYTQNVARMTSL